MLCSVARIREIRNSRFGILFCCTCFCQSC